MADKEMSMDTESLRETIISRAFSKRTLTMKQNRKENTSYATTFGNTFPAVVLPVFILPVGNGKTHRFLNTVTSKTSIKVSV